MVRTYARKSVNIPHKRVWKLLSDLESPSEFHPMIKRAEITSSHRKGIGATRTLHYIDGSKETEEVVQIGQGYITFMPKTYQGNQRSHYTLTYTVKRLLSEWTEVALEANYDIKMGPWGVMRYLFPVASTERRLQRQFQKVLEGIEYHLTTHKRVRKCAMESKIATSLHNHIKISKPHPVQTVGAV